MPSNPTSIELKTSSSGVISTRWDAELLRDLKRQKQREYKLRYRLRHPKRLRTRQSLYKARWKAKTLGLEPPPLPQDWDQVLGGFEIHFARGVPPGQSANTPSRRLLAPLLPPILPSATKRFIYDSPSPSLWKDPKTNPVFERAAEAVIEIPTRKSKASKPVGHVYLRCRLCRRTFRRFKGQIVHREGSFCSNQCRYAAWHLFSEALAMEELEPILQELVAAVKKRDQAEGRWHNPRNETV